MGLAVIGRRAKLNQQKLDLTNPGHQDAPEQRNSVSGYYFIHKTYYIHKT